MSVSPGQSHAAISFLMSAWIGNECDAQVRMFAWTIFSSPCSRADRRSLSDRKFWNATTYSAPACANTDVWLKVPPGLKWLFFTFLLLHFQPSWTFQLGLICQSECVDVHQKDKQTLSCLLSPLHPGRKSRTPRGIATPPSWALLINTRPVIHSERAMSTEYRVSANIYRI